MNPFTPPTLAALAQQYGTPLWVYDAATITRQIRALRQFDVVRFAQKANSNIHILRHMKSLGVVVDSVSLGAAKARHPVWLRITPGFGHGHSNKTNTGGEQSKHGIWHGDLALTCAKVRAHGLALQGLHMHIGSGVDYVHLQEVCGAMVQLVAAVKAQGLDVQAISAGGGLSIPYRAGEPTIDTAHYFSMWDAARVTWWPSRACC